MSDIPFVTANTASMAALGRAQAAPSVPGAWGRHKTPLEIHRIERALLHTPTPPATCRAGGRSAGRRVCSTPKSSRTGRRG